MESTFVPVANGELDAKKVRSRYKKCLDEIVKHYSDKDNTAEEVVHNLRVNLKRVDALVALLSFADHKIAAKKLKPFNTLFQRAGKLRSIQVEFGVVSKYFNDVSFNSRYHHQLHKIMVKRLAKYSEFLQSGVPRPLKGVAKILKERINKLTKRQIIQYFRDEERRLSRRLKRSIFREQELHAIRKDLKRYYLNLKISDYHNEHIEKMLDLLGAWHDHQIAFDHVIKTIYTVKLTEPESEHIKKIKYHLINDKESLYEKIVSYYVLDMQ